MTFGEAIKAVRNGERIQREGWNGKNQYVELATGISYKNTAGEIVNVNHDAIGNQALAFVGTSGVQLGWLASQADMLAEDWRILDCNCFTLDFRNSSTGYIEFDGKRFKAKLLNANSRLFRGLKDEVDEITFAFWADDESKGR